MSASGPDQMATTFAEFGLHCIRPATSGSCVIFVHGILSSGESAWGSPSWPDLLAQEADLDDFGIFVFTYRTSISSRTYSISDAADALREHLSIAGLLDMPALVFVCHSMGGIVVRRFLVSNQARLIDLDPTIGLFLVASPSLGSRDANMLSVLSFALQHTQAAVLRFSQANTSLDELHRDFRTLLNGRRLCIVGRELIEDRPIKIKRYAGLWRQVVEPFAAAAYFHHEGYEPLRIPGSDHSTIVKPLRRDALQHVMLKGFLTKFPELSQAHCGDRSQRQDRSVEETTRATIVDSKTDTRMIAQSSPSLVLDEIARAAVLPEQLISTDLPSPDDDPTAVYRFAAKLRTGRMLGRILSSTLVARHRDPGAILHCALANQVPRREFESVAPWMRFASESAVRSIQGAIYDRPDDGKVESIRLKALIMGWAGETLLPRVDWTDRYHQDKFSSYYVKAYLHAAWRDQSESELRYLVSMCLDACAAYKAHFGREVSFFDFLSAVEGIPASNSKIILGELTKEEAPGSMISAILYRMCLTPSPDTLTNIRRLMQHPGSDVSKAAQLALAFIPARSTAVRELKGSLLTGPSFAAAAGVDLQADATDELGRLLAAGEEGSYYAAWALTKLAGQFDPARKLIQEAAVESSDKLVRCICLIGLAIGSPRDWASHIADEYESARDMEKFCLSIALSYTSDARPMLSLLANTGEDRLYVPYMHTCFQSLFRDAMKHAATNSPILGEMLSLTDDP